jgi:cytochrome c553
MHRRSKSLIAAGMLALVSLAAQADGDAANGGKLAYTCMGCHGIENYKNAYPKYSVPKLAGQNAAYVVAALGEYQSGSRWHPTMQGFASALSDQDRADLAAHFSGLAKAPASADPAGAPPPQAETCAACHGKNGQGTMDEYPNIGGQHVDYLAQALNDYRRGKRRNPIMQPFAQRLTQDDIRTLAEFFSSQKGLETPQQD